MLAVLYLQMSAAPLDSLFSPVYAWTYVGRIKFPVPGPQPSSYSLDIIAVLNVEYKPLRTLASFCTRQYYRVRRWVGLTPHGYLFVLAHMRSGSSLLSHVLCTNPDIIGFGECHLSYPTIGTLGRLVDKVYLRRRRLRMRERFILDKILHEHLELGHDILRADSCRFVFLIREPEGSLRSMVRAFPDWFSGTPLSDEQLSAKALRHYRARLASLCQLAAAIADSERACLLTYNQLVEQPAQTLAALTQFLSLATPLRDEYDITPLTGLAGYGDSSENIRSGRIVRRTATDTMFPIPLSRVLPHGVDAFDHTIRCLSEHCTVI